MQKVSKTLVLVMCLSAIMASFAFAADTTTYTLDELYMQVSIPTDLAVFTRNINADDPNLAVLGTDKQSLEEYYTANNIYLNALAKDYSFELVITMTTTDASQASFNFNLYDDAELKEIGAGTKEGYANMGIDVTNFSNYQSEASKYVVLDTTAKTSEGVSAYRRQFYTVYNGQAINISLNSYTGEVTQELGATLQDVVDSVIFTETLPTPEDNLALKRANFFDSLPERAATRFMIGGIAAFIVAVVFAIKCIMKKNAFAGISNEEIESRFKNSDDNQSQLAIYHKMFKAANILAAFALYIIILR